MKKEYEYNPAFQKLVKGKKDIIGLLAYSLSEENKLLLIAKMKSGANPPSKDEIEKIVNTIPTDEELRGYHEHADFIVRDFLESYRKNKVRPEIEKECYNKIQEQVSHALIPIERSIQDVASKIPEQESTKAKYRDGIIQSMIAAVLMALIVYYVFPAVEYTHQKQNKEQTEQKKDTKAPTDSLPPKEITLQPQKSVSSQPKK